MMKMTMLLLAAIPHVAMMELETLEVFDNLIDVY